MGVKLDFRQFPRQYTTVKQGVFWLQSDRWFPKGLLKLNLGMPLSEQLLPLTLQQRKENLLPIIRKIIEPHNALILENIQVLFLPSLETDLLGLMVALARNRVLCAVWPGQITEQRLEYAQPESPEYVSYEFKKYVDTYVITG